MSNRPEIVYVDFSSLRSCLVSLSLSLPLAVYARSSASFCLPFSICTVKACNVFALGNSFGGELCAEEADKGRKSGIAGRDPAGVRVTGFIEIMMTGALLFPP